MRDQQTRDERDGVESFDINKADRAMILLHTYNRCMAKFTTYIVADVGGDWGDVNYDLDVGRAFDVPRVSSWVYDIV
jgi:hypothetical protein